MSAALSLGPELTIAYAAEWHARLAQAVEAASGDLLLDLAPVTDFDSSGVQLLLSARASLARRGHALAIGASSGAVTDALTLFGLQDLLPTAGA